MRFGAAWFLALYAVCIVFVTGLIFVWLRRANSSLAELGWGKPTTILAVALGIIAKRLSFIFDFSFFARFAFFAGKYFLFPIMSIQQMNFPQ